MLATRILRTARISTRAVVHHPPRSSQSLLPHLRNYAYPSRSSSPALLRPYSSASPSNGLNSPAIIQPTSEQAQTDPQDARYSITFTCTVPDCGERTSHTFTKHAYHRGIVIIQCPGCKNRHLIADNLGWFKDDRTEEGSLRNIEDIMRAKGESVKKGRLDAGGVVEYSE